MVLLKMLSDLNDLMQRIRDALRPYTFQDYIDDIKPQTWSELKAAERNWNHYKNDFSSRF